MGAGKIRRDAMRKLGWMLLAAVPLLAQRRYTDDRNWRLDETETIRRTFDTSASGRKLLVDNVSGFVHVTGYGGSQIQVVAEKHLLAANAEAMQEAKRDIKLDMTQQ